MKLNFFKASEFEQRLKCTIHKTGKLGFSESAIKKLEIGQKRCVKIGTSEDDELGENLYMVFTQEEDGEGFKINKAGNYYYVNTKSLFDKLGYDYLRKTIIFDIVEIDYPDLKVYKLLKKEMPKRKQEE